MRKSITYTTFFVAGVFVVFVFVTAKSYTQLGLAVVLYLPLAYFALQLFPRKARSTPIVSDNPLPNTFSASIEKLEETDTTNNVSGSVDIADIDKRAFLKMVGAAGLSFFVFSLLSRKAESLFLGGGSSRPPSGPTTTTIQDVDGTKIDPAQRQPTDGYRISEIDDNIITYYGFTNKDEAWIIMREDTNTNSFRYIKGDSDFPRNWQNREHLNYDYFHNVF
jgi:hypothetical protein